MNTLDLDRHICGDNEEFVCGSHDQRVPVTSDMLEPARFLQAEEIGNCEGCHGPCTTDHHVCPLLQPGGGECTVCHQWCWGSHDVCEKCASELAPGMDTAMSDQGQLQAALNHVYGQHPSFGGYVPNAYRTGVPNGGSQYNQVAICRISPQVRIEYRDGICRILLNNEFPDAAVPASQAEAIAENLCLAADVCRQLDSRQM